MNNKIVALSIIIISGSIGLGIALSLWMHLGNVNSPSSEETLQITDASVWCWYGFPNAQAAVSMYNGKNTPATITEVAIRGNKCEWSDVYYWKGEIGAVSSLNFASSESTETSVEIVVDGKNRTFRQALGKIELEGFKAIVLYIRNAGNITFQDLPDGNVTITIFSERNVYLKEVRVNSDLQFGFMQTEQLSITSARASAGTDNNIKLVANNTGTTGVTINDVWVNNIKIASNAIVFDPSASISANSGVEITLDYNVVAGCNYQIKLITAKGNSFTYTLTAPT